MEKSEMLKVRIEPELKQKLWRIAEKRGLSAGEVIRRYIQHIPDEKQ